jgi:N-ethylmaleimide reductase
VHKKGGHIFLQLWHVGRISHPDLQPGGALPVAPSAVLPEGQAFTSEGFKPLVTPRALETDEIPRIVGEYAHAAKLAKDAGFDGVEIHAANGYLLQQFLADKTNLRTDRYGGSIENRARIVVEVAEAVTKVWGGGERVGIRLSPTTTFGDIGDSNPEPVYLHLIEQLNRLGLVYIHVIEGDTQRSRNPPGAFDPQSLRKAFKGLYIANNGYDLKLALEARAQNLADLICFGRPFISNPDLVERLRVGAPLAEGDRNTYYGGGAKGYTDYPSL